jgi:hypothetical protein
VQLLPRVVTRQAAEDQIAEAAVPSGPSRSRTAKRWVALGVAGAACCLAMTGCSEFDKALGQSSVQVFFTDNTTVSQMIKIMNACNNVNPDVKEEQNPAKIPPEDFQAIYNTTGADDAQIAQLEECLSKYPQVQGINPTDSSDDS